jgi:hypothetical protein
MTESSYCFGKCHRNSGQLVTFTMILTVWCFVGDTQKFWPVSLLPCLFWFCPATDTAIATEVLLLSFLFILRDMKELPYNRYGK